MMGFMTKAMELFRKPSDYLKGQRGAVFATVLTIILALFSIAYCIYQFELINNFQEAAFQQKFKFPKILKDMDKYKREIKAEQTRRLLYYSAYEKSLLGAAVGIHVSMIVISAVFISSALKKQYKVFPVWCIMGILSLLTAVAYVVMDDIVYKFQISNVALTILILFCFLYIYCCHTVYVYLKGCRDAMESNLMISPSSTRSSAGSLREITIFNPIDITSLGNDHDSSFTALPPSYDQCISDPDYAKPPDYDYPAADAEIEDAPPAYTESEDATAHLQTSSCEVHTPVQLQTFSCGVAAITNLNPNFQTESHCTNHECQLTTVSATCAQPSPEITQLDSRDSIECVTSSTPAPEANTTHAH